MPRAWRNGEGRYDHRRYMRKARELKRYSTKP
jgi:hypothetical protein